MSISSAIDVFQNAPEIFNKIMNNENPTPFDVDLVSPSGEYIQCMGGFRLEVNTSMNEIKKADLVIVTSLYSEDETKLFLPEIRKWLLKMHLSGSMLASFCTGTFVLASTGLLNGKTATTHWASARKLSQRYPQIHVKPHKMICDEGTIFTSGGSHGALDLCLYLVEKLYGKALALNYAKILVHDISFTEQSAYAIFKGLRDHRDTKIWEIQDYIESHYSEHLGISYLANKAAMSRRTFERRFKAATGESPGDYIQQLRIEAAKRILEMEFDTFEQITLRVGYEDATTFSKLFSKRVGVTPTSYRNKFHSGQTIP